MDARMPHVVALSGIVLLSAALSHASAQPPEIRGPLKVAPGQRYLQDAEGKPFLWLGDTAWALFYKLDRDEVKTYLDDRQGKGFNVIQAVAYWYPHGEDGPGPHNAPNAYGHRPFHGPDDAPDTGKPLVVPGGSPDEPNDYWDHADFIVREVRRRGMRLALLPCWGRAFVNALMDKSRQTLDEDTARRFGRFLGERYGNEPHVVWVIGGDVNPTKGAGDRRGVYRAMAEAVGSAATGVKLRWDQPNPAWDKIFMTYHPEGDPLSSSSKFFHAEPWLDANGIETWKSVDKIQPAVAHNYGLADPVKPTLFLEGAYEGGRYPEPGGQITDLKVRRQAWQAMLAGSAGHTYGASSIWHFQRKLRGDVPAEQWKKALQLPAARQTAEVLGRILAEHEWWTLVPDQALIAEGASKGELMKVAARAADSSRILVYFPDATAAKLNLPKRPYAATWIRPESGERAPAAADGAGRFTPPAGWPDALLAIDGRPKALGPEKE